MSQLRARVQHLVTLLMVGAIGSAVQAAPLPPKWLAEASGLPVAQLQRTADVAVVSTPEGAVCVLSRTIGIESSRYFSARERVPFDHVRRSRAASFQMVSAAGEPDAPDLRIQFKYPLDPSAPIRLGGRPGAINLLRHAEPAGDSVLIPAAAAAPYVEALARGEAVAVSATSRDTGHWVEDALRLDDDADAAARALAALADCAAGLDGGAGPEGPPPQGALSLRLALAPTPETLTTPEEARVCGMTDLDGPLHRGRLLETTGFVAPASTVFGRFDEDGVLQAVYLPGVFEARRDPQGGYAASVSVAANANTPFEPHAVSGCLGEVPATLCLYPSEGPGVLALGPCVSEELQFAVGTLPEAEPLSFLSTPSGGAGGFGQGGRRAEPGYGPLPPLVFGPLFPGNLGSERGGGGGALPPPEGEPLPTPVPGALGLLTAGLALFVALGLSRAPLGGGRVMKDLGRRNDAPGGASSSTEA